MVASGLHASVSGGIVGAEIVGLSLSLTARERIHEEAGMKPRYVKPQARDLGGTMSMLALGQWDGPPLPGGPGGAPGDSMLTCNVGGYVGSSCVAGSDYYGSICFTGNKYSIPTCNTGAEATVACSNGLTAAL